MTSDSAGLFSDSSKKKLLEDAYKLKLVRASQVVQLVKNLPANIGDARDTTSISGSGRSPKEMATTPDVLPEEPHE